MNRKERKSPRGMRPVIQPAAERLIRALVAGCGSPAEVLELYYWSKEPGLIEVIRGIAAMPEDTRAAIEAFVALARDANSVTAILDPRGALTLASAEAAKAAALVHYAAEQDGDEMPRVLN
jgi:hypothetical protein